MMTRRILSALAILALFQCSSCRLDEFESEPSETFNNVSGLYSGGGNTHCAIDGDDVKCWLYTDFDNHQLTGKTLNNPRTLAVGWSVVCGIDDDGLTCWIADESVHSDKGESVLGVPELDNPTGMVIGLGHACAIDATGLVCWGDNDFGETDVPASMQDATSVVAGPDFTCALKDQDVECWGVGLAGELDAPTGLSNPGNLTNSNEDRTCLIDDGGVKCWGSMSDGDLDIPNFEDPTSVATGEGHFCAVDSGEVSCWGRLNTHGQQDVPQSLSDSEKVVAGTSSTCALSTGGKVTCWGGF